MRNSCSQKEHVLTRKHSKNLIEVQATAAPLALWRPLFSGTSKQDEGSPSCQKWLSLNSMRRRLPSAQWRWGGYVWHSRHPMRASWSSWPTWMGYMQQAWPETFMFNRKSGSSQKVPRPTYMVAEGERNLEWRVEEGDDEHQLWPWDQLQRWELNFVSLTSLYPSEVRQSL